MTKFPDLFGALAAPFEPHEVRVRTQGNKQMHYITARVAMNRLDSVVGPENWTESYVPGENSVLCILSITLPDGQQAVKSDAGGYAGMSDSGDDDKSGYSDAFKRAAVKFGVGRYLYGDGSPQFGRTPADGAESEPPAARDGLPSQARPEHPPEPEPMRAPPARQRAPTSGGALWRWAKDHDERDDVGLVEHLTRWAKHERFPAKMIQWNPEQVSRAYAEAVQQLQATTEAAR